MGEWPAAELDLGACEMRGEKVRRRTGLGGPRFCATRAIRLTQGRGGVTNKSQQSEAETAKPQRPLIPL